MAPHVPGPPLRFHPRVAEGLEELLTVWPSVVRADGIDGLRRVTEEFLPSPEDYVAGFDGRHVDVTVPSGQPGQRDVVVATYAPRALERGAPCLYFIHSGGMISGTRYSDEMQLLTLAAELGAVAVSVEYRLAPEHPYPAAIDDCQTGFDWIMRNAGDLGVDPSRVVIVGESAGGGLAAALSIRLRDRGGVMPCGQLLAAPMLDDRNGTVSAMQMDGVGCWDRVSNETGWNALLGSAAGGPDTPPDAAPARADDLADLPETFIDVGSAEIFRDECIDVASRLMAAGVQAELHVWPGGCHTFYAVAPTADISLLTFETRLSWLRRVLRVEDTAR